MSDTPRTDQQAREWDDGFSMPSDLIALARELERENAALRKQAVEVLMIGRAWSEVCFDHLSPASVEQFIALEKQILKQGKEAQP